MQHQTIEPILLYICIYISISDLTPVCGKYIPFLLIDALSKRSTSSFRMRIQSMDEWSKRIWYEITRLWLKPILFLESISSVTRKLLWPKGRTRFWCHIVPFHDIIWYCLDVSFLTARYLRMDVLFYFYVYITTFFVTCSLIIAFLLSWHLLWLYLVLSNLYVRSRHNFGYCMKFYKWR